MTIPTEAERMAALAKKNDERLAYLEKCVKTTLRLCAKSGEVPGYEWMAEPRPYSNVETHRAYTGGRKPNHRTPPLPFHSFVHKGGGTCRVCGQPIYGKGDHQVKKQTDKRLRTWHDVCVTTYTLMTTPNNYAMAIASRQDFKCAITGDDLAGRTIDVDHEIPLYRVARDHRGEPWHRLLRFWTLSNLRAITNEAHKAKNAQEARERSGRPVGDFKVQPILKAAPARPANGVWCDDWRCPSRSSCAQHFGRSNDYAAMREGARVESIEHTGAYNWMIGADAGQSCDKYRLDEPKAWLEARPGQPTHSLRTA